MQLGRQVRRCSGRVDVGGERGQDVLVAGGHGCVVDEVDAAALCQVDHGGQDVGEQLGRARGVVDVGGFVEEAGEHVAPPVPQGFVAIEPHRESHGTSVTDERVST